jgi:hypothetical protein
MTTIGARGPCCAALTDAAAAGCRVHAQWRRATLDDLLAQPHERDAHAA